MYMHNYGGWVVDKIRQKSRSIGHLPVLRLVDEEEAVYAKQNGGCFVEISQWSEEEMKCCVGRGDSPRKGRESGEAEEEVEELIKLPPNVITNLPHL